MTRNILRDQLNGVYCFDKEIWVIGLTYEITTYLIVYVQVWTGPIIFENCCQNGVSNKKFRRLLHDYLPIISDYQIDVA
jgi:hypothetical protein